MYILEVVKECYKLQFKVLPNSVQLRNNRSARDNPGFVSQQIQTLLKEKGYYIGSY